MDKNSVSYKKCLEIKEKYGIPITTTWYRLEQGMSGEALTQKTLNRKEIVVDGKPYPSISEAVRKTGIPESTIRNRIRKGQDLGRDIRPHIKVEFNGQEYPSIKAAAKAAGLSETSFRRYQKQGYTDQEIIVKANKKKARAKHKHENRHLSSLREVLLSR